ncbi:MAG TPA: sodium:proton antiporter [Ignavibacteriaceae bacterium]|nr:sodium:proton antiporter [Ignavibacteriaceae bacterium]
MRNGSRIIAAIILSFFFYCNVSAAEVPAVQDSIQVKILEQAGEHVLPTPYMVIPFILLLLMIATGPLFYKHFWERHYPKLAIILGLVTVVYYLIFLNEYHSLLHIFAEYISFIALLSSLFVASGGIFIKVDKKATPYMNVLFLLFGAVISNVIGTTGASMLLIRPYIKMNQNRIKAYHVIFFIFIVSNIGGALTPIGDPPLFIGFLRGVPFFWVLENVWFIWIPMIMLILGVFFLFDKFNDKGNDTPVQNGYTGKVEFKGFRNLGYLAVIIFSVFLDPGVFSWVPDWSPLPFGIREVIMFAVVYLSYKQADPEILRSNEFDFEPIKEVAYLFIGIFLTMVPALQLIAEEARVNRDLLNAGTFYWATGGLSSFLDNTPTYLNFQSAAMGKYTLDVNVKAHVLDFVSQDIIYLRAISVAAVFFGSMTYIGNGPNFMVKSICERAGIEMPSFFTYMIKYSIPILIPLFLIIYFLFFH